MRPDAPKTAMLAWRAVEELTMEGDLLATKADALPTRRAVAMVENFMVIIKMI